LQEQPLKPKSKKLTKLLPLNSILIETEEKAKLSKSKPQKNSKISLRLMEFLQILRKKRDMIVGKCNMTEIKEPVALKT
jgi:hypothetical protein